MAARRKLKPFIRRRLKIDPPCSVDFCNKWEIQRHIRDLLNMSEFLLNGIELELYNLRRKLKSLGYDKDHIDEFMEGGARGTRWERLIPRMPRELGDMIEWKKNKHRWEK